ncbi:unnamed protein product [Amoebophrya sp. A120]|nr:unnamed protein product [Amoebophrya sp. A120]|eukprot:GSA120T00022179001.1
MACFGGGKLKKERDALAQQKQDLEAKVAQQQAEAQQLRQKLQQAETQAKTAKTTADEEKGQRENVQNQLNKELTKLQKDKDKVDKRMKILQQEFTILQTEADKTIQQYAIGDLRKKPFLLLFEAYDGDNGTFLGEQLLIGTGEFALMDRAVHSRYDASKEQASASKNPTRRIHVVCEESNDQLAVRSLYQEGGSSSSTAFSPPLAGGTSASSPPPGTNSNKVDYHSVLYKVWLKRGKMTAKSGAAAGGSAGTEQPLDSEQEQDEGKEKPAVWEQVAMEHSEIIPGDLLEDPNQYGWVAGFSNGLSTEEPLILDYEALNLHGYNTVELHRKDHEFLTTRVQYLESEKMERDRMETDLGKLRMVLEEKDRELELKLTEAKKLLDIGPGGNLSAKNLSGLDRNAAGKIDNEQLKLLEKLQPVNVHLPGKNLDLSSENKLRFFRLLCATVDEETSNTVGAGASTAGDHNLLFQNEELEVYWLQSFPYNNDDFYHHAERGLLAGRIDLKLVSRGFESIHLKCTNNDVKGLKVVPLPISAAANTSTAENGPPQVIIQTICVELLELVEAHPFVKCDITVLDSATTATSKPDRAQHECTFALPIILLKFVLPWECLPQELSRHMASCVREDSGNMVSGMMDLSSVPDNKARTASKAPPPGDLITGETFPTKFLTLGGLFCEIERKRSANGNTEVCLGSSLVKHGSLTEQDLHIGVKISSKGNLIEVYSYNRKLSNIVLALLLDFYSYCCVHLHEM